MGVFGLIGVFLFFYVFYLLYVYKTILFLLSVSHNLGALFSSLLFYSILF